MSSKSRAGRIETHLSTWMNGESAIKKSKLRAPRSAQNPLPGKKIHLVPGSTVHLDGYAMRSAPTPLPRSADLHSPTNFSRPLASDQWHSPQQPYLHPAFASPVATNAPCDALSKHRRRHRKEKTRAHRSGICGMKSNDPRIQSKGIGTIVSGTVLAVVLSVYLAMATANAAPTTAFHATFIFCIIVLTIVFLHFLVRLCMLVLRAQPGYSRHQPLLRIRGRRTGRRLDLETGLAQPSVSVNRVSSPSEKAHSESARTAGENVVAPPAYGWWRGSVRVDPGEMRFHDPDQNELHQHTRSLIFAGSGQRPPSYSSDSSDRAINQPEPLFHRPLGDASTRMGRQV